MASREVWVQGQTQQTGAGAVRIWHLAETPDVTLCGRATESMKALPQAAWDQVLNPCTQCRTQNELPAGSSTGPAAEPVHRESDESTVSEMGGAPPNSTT